MSVCVAEKDVSAGAVVAIIAEELHLRGGEAVKQPQLVLETGADFVVFLSADYGQHSFTRGEEEFGSDFELVKRLDDAEGNDVIS